MARPPSETGTKTRVAIDPEDPTHLVGHVIDGRYHLTSLVGRGGMGAVFLAEHVTIRRRVAVKLLVPSLASIPELARRFEREAFAIGRIDHPNCVTVLDFGRLDDGSLYLVMEYLAGRSLADLVDGERSLASRRALHIVRHVLRGLGHAHHAGIVHRDVKPENVILIEHDGVPDFAKILDFGIARVIGHTPFDMEEGEERLTQAGIAFGTPAYISPEQAIGDPVDPRADLYSVTVMLFEMLTGRPPFYSPDKLELLGMHATRPPPRLRDMRPDLLVPPVLDEMVVRGLAKRPADRFADAEAYVAAIERCLFERLDGDYAGSTPPSDTEPVAVTGVSSPGAARAIPAREQFATSSPLTVVERPRGRFASLLSLLTGLLVASGGAAAVWFLFLRPAHDIDLLADLRSPAAEEAARTLVAGDPAETIELLTEEPAVLTGDAQAQLQLGHAHAARSEYARALAVYKSALLLDPGLLRDERLRANLRLMFDEDGPVLLEAARTLAVMAEDEPARQRIVELAASRDRAVRKKAFALAETLGVGDRIDRVTSFALDLKQEPTCPGRREAVTKLRALADARAIGSLRAVLVKPAALRKKRRRPKDPNACLRQHAEDAVRYLESVAAEEPSPPASSDAAATGSRPTQGE